MDTGDLVDHLADIVKLRKDTCFMYENPLVAYCAQKCPLSHYKLCAKISEIEALLKEGGD